LHELDHGGGAKSKGAPYRETLQTTGFYVGRIVIVPEEFAPIPSPPHQIIIPQVFVGTPERPYAGDPQPLHQPILRRSEISFDSPFRLRRVRRDPRDSQLAQGSSDLRRRHLHRVLVHSRLVPAPLLVIAEQACLVRVKCYRMTEPVELKNLWRELAFAHIRQLGAAAGSAPSKSKHPADIGPSPRYGL
jgi:hypothetical protein